MKSINIHLTIALGILLLAAPITKADIQVFDSIGLADIGELGSGYQIGGDDTQSIAAQFTVSSAVYLTSIDFALKRWSGSSTLSVRIYSDDGSGEFSLPDSILATSTVSTVSTDPEIATATFSGDLLLGGDTKYYVSLSPDNFTDHSWVTNGAGMPVYASFDGGSTWPGGSTENDIALFRVHGSLSPSMVPEPSAAAALVGLGALLAAVTRRRRR